MRLVRIHARDCRAVWLVAAAIVGWSSAAAAIPAPPTFSPEHDLTTPVLTGATGEQTAPQAAWNGQQLLVTWRSSAWQNELRVARLAADGAPLDPRGVALAGVGRGDAIAAVAAGGNDFLIAWTQDPGQVVTTLVRGDGPLVLPPPTVVTAGEADGSTHDPALAWNGSGYWVAYTRGADATRLWAQRVSAAGQPVDPTPLGLGLAAPQPPALASQGTRTLLVWSVPNAGMTELRGVRLEADGRALDAQPIVLATLAGDVPGPVAVVAHGTGFVAAAAGIHAGAFTEMRLVQVTIDGVPGAGVSLPLTTGAARGGPALLDAGSAVQALWSIVVPDGVNQVARFQAARVDDGGMSQPPVLPPAISTGEQATMIATGGDPFLVWGETTRYADDGSPINVDVRGVRLSTPLPAPQRLSQAPSWQSEPAVAWSGQHLLLAFSDARDDLSGSDVYATRLDDRGQPLDGAGIPLGVGPAPQHAPALAWDGQQFVVLWHEGDRGLAVARVRDDGTVVDATPLTVPGSDGQAWLSEPAVCADGDGVLIVWAARKTAIPAGMPSDLAGELRGLRVPRGGAITGTTSFLLTGIADSDLPPTVRIGCNDSAAVVAWSGVLAPGEPPRLHFARIVRSGQQLDLRPGLVTIPGQNSGELAGIASDGHGFLIAWRAFNPTGQRTVYAERIDGDGYLLDRDFIPIGLSNSGRRVTALWDGRQYLVFAVNTDGGNPFEWRARRIDGTGFVVDRDWITAAVLSKPWGGGGTGGDGAVMGPGRSFLAYEQYAEDDAASNPRARGRFMDSTMVTIDAGTDAALDATVGADAVLTDGGPDATGGGDDGGCGCRIGDHARPGAGAIALLAFVMAWARRRPRSR